MAGDQNGEPDDPQGQIRRYTDGPKDFALPESAARWCEQISRHVEHYVGAVPTVWHELISSHVHIDVLWVPPTDDRPWNTLVTSGMSDRPMTVPEGAEEFRFAELCMMLPPDWAMTEEAFKDERNYWPIRLLKAMARFPHEYETWLGYGHSMPNGDPPAPFAPNTELCGVVLWAPVSLPEGFETLGVHDDKVINFLALYPLYREEMNFKVRHGVEGLMPKLAEGNVGDILDLARPNVCRLAKKWWKFW